MIILSLFYDKNRTKTVILSFYKGNRSLLHRDVNADEVNSAVNAVYNPDQSTTTTTTTTNASPDAVASALKNVSIDELQPSNSTTKVTTKDPSESDDLKSESDTDNETAVEKDNLKDSDKMEVDGDSGHIDNTEDKTDDENVEPDMAELPEDWSEDVVMNAPPNEPAVFGRFTEADLTGLDLTISEEASNNGFKNNVLWAQRVLGSVNFYFMSHKL